MIRAQINNIWLTDSTNSAFLAGRCDWMRDSYPRNHLIQQLLSLKLYLYSQTWSTFLSTAPDLAPVSQPHMTLLTVMFLTRLE